MTYCTSCGTRSPEGSAFCGSCGTALAQMPAAHTAAAPKPTPWGRILAVRSRTYCSAGWICDRRAGLRGLPGQAEGGRVHENRQCGERARKRRRLRSPPENGDSGKSPNNNNNENEQVSKALDGIGGLMDRLGFGDPPPNPYADLPVATLGGNSKNLCTSADTAKELVPPAASEIGPSGIPMREGLMLIHAWGRKSGDSESINRVTKVTDKYVEVADSGTYFSSADDVKGSPGADARDVCAEDLQTAHGLRTDFGDNGPRTSPGTTTISVSQAVFNDLKTRGKTDFRYLEWWKVQDMERAKATCTGTAAS